LSNEAPPLTRVCKTCGSEKALEEFTGRIDAKYGRRHECKKCTSSNSIVTARRRRLNDPEPYRESARKQYAKPKQKQKIKNRVAAYSKTENGKAVRGKAHRKFSEKRSLLRQEKALGHFDHD
jgi:hypothetical protein